MQQHSTHPSHEPALGRTVQSYIDERPSWPDGTPVPVTPMTTMQWRIWGLAAAGKFFEGLVVFMTGVAMPLIANEFGLGAVEHGVVGAASLAGILVGALLLGGLADQFGRKLMFIVEMVLFIIFLMLLSVAPSYVWLVIFLFGIGLALGCDYPTAHLIISESIPTSARGRLVLGAFAFQAVGALVGTGVGYVVLTFDPDVTAWRWMYAAAIIPAMIVLAGRFFVTESAPWLFARGRKHEAERETARLLQRKPTYPKKVVLSATRQVEAGASGWKALFDRRNRRATILASVPWFLQDLSTYGIGIFTPTILAAALGHDSGNARNIAEIIQNDIGAAEGAAMIDVLLIVGIIFAVALADRVGRVPLQILGFIGCAAGLLIASFSAYYDGTMGTALIFIGFMMFNFMTNLGPNAQTYLLAGEVFPTAIRGKGAGFAAAFAKMGAVLTAFGFPILLASIGQQALLYGLVVMSLLGAAVTWWFRIETTGVSLDAVGTHGHHAAKAPVPDSAIAEL
ncbi:MFS transporter [Ancylobacter vacuolatus]|uniref:MFS family permease n=1 Tax=Ancylobacter vacuolatus TaxID=223389 RepID=A0ABU0DG65_9HYPH|nr:MFS transporter [Ancylobacter vacuolatus]MDQ0347323.1 MFS family permease [Ancylobacter vacuolatus]